MPCGAGCPEGFVCRKAQMQGTTTDAEVCFPNGGGTAGADCTFGPAACESGLCIRKDSGPVCTRICADTTECPDGWTCSVVRTVTEQSAQACLPPTVQ